MLSTCHSVARQIFQSAATKMRNLEGYSQQREKLASLGTMAAGLAHELNNPASAARRAAAHLRETTDKAQTLLCHLSKILKHDQWHDLALASQDAAERLARAPALDNIERSDRADQIATWLQARGVADVLGTGSDLCHAPAWTFRGWKNWRPNCRRKAMPMPWPGWNRA